MTFEHNVFCLRIAIDDVCIASLAVLFYGLIATLMCFVVMQLGGTVYQVSNRS